jgi:predicted amidohydrolase
MKVALAAVQLAVDAEALASLDAYRRVLESAASEALAGTAGDARLVVFPEASGHLALYANAGPAARRARTLRGALAASAARRPLEVLRSVATTRQLDPRHAVLAALVPDAERWWKQVMAPLARRHEAYVVAGSHVRLGAHGELCNASVLFGPDGRQLAVTDKMNLVAGLEDGGKGGLALARGSEPPVVTTPFGRLVTLVGYDAFLRPAAAHERFAVLAERLAATVVANPASNPLAWPDARWQADGLAASLARVRGAQFGVEAQLVGHLLDLRFGGTSQIVARRGNTVEVLARAGSPDRGGFVVQLVNVD